MPHRVSSAPRPPGTCCGRTTPKSARSARRSARLPPTTAPSSPAKPNCHAFAACSAPGSRPGFARPPLTPTNRVSQRLGRPLRPEAIALCRAPAQIGCLRWSSGVRSCRWPRLTLVTHFVTPQRHELFFVSRALDRASGGGKPDVWSAGSRPGRSRSRRWLSPGRVRGCRCGRSRLRSGCRGGGGLRARPG